MIAWFSLAMRSYSCLRTVMFRDVTDTLLSILYAGSAFMMEYIFPRRILFSRSMLELRPPPSVHVGILPYVRIRLGWFHVDARFIFSSFLMLPVDRWSSRRAVALFATFMLRRGGHRAREGDAIAMLEERKQQRRKQCWHTLLTF